VYTFVIRIVGISFLRVSVEEGHCSGERGEIVNRVSAATVTQWAFDRGVPADLEQMAEDLRGLILDPSSPAAAAPDANQLDLPGPRLGESTGGDHLPDALCMLLQRYLSPAREGDPVLLGELLRLVQDLRPTGAREVVTGLLLGGAYRGVAGPYGRLEQQMLRVLQRMELEDAERGLLQQLLAEPAPAEEPAEPPEPSTAPEAEDPEVLRGDQVPQVNDPDQVFSFVAAVADGVNSRRSYAHHARVSVRQADFIARAAASLGLVRIVGGGNYELTELGASLPGAEDPAGREARHQIVGGHPLMTALEIQVGDTLPQIPQIEALLLARTALGAGTVRRRAQALLRWVEWWASGGR